MGGYTVGVAGQTVNLLCLHSGGSTPSPPIPEVAQLAEPQSFKTTLVIELDSNSFLGKTDCCGFESRLPVAGVLK